MSEIAEQSRRPARALMTDRAAAQVSRLGLSLLLLGVVALLVVAPLLIIVVASFSTAVPFASAEPVDFTLDNYLALFTPEVGRASMNTLIVSVGGTVIAVSIGTALAWLGARSDISGKWLVHLAGIMPLFVSLVVASVTWSFLGSGRSGYLNLILEWMNMPFRLEMRSLAGITFVHGMYYVPYAYVFVYGALSLIHPDLEQAASVHGAKLHNVLRVVTLPLVRPALISATLLCFVSMAEEFPVPAILGGPVGIETLSMRIYNLMSRVPVQANQAAAVSVLLTAIVFAFVFTQRRVLHGKDYRTVTGKGMQSRQVKLGRFKPFAVGFVVLYTFVALGLPMLALLFGSLRPNLYIADAADLFDVSKFSLRALQGAVQDASVQRGLVNSLIAGAGTALFGTALYFTMAYATNRSRLPGRHLLDYMALIPLAVPALVLGLGVLWTWLSLPFPVYGTMIILIIAYIARYMPQGQRTISSSISQIHNELEEAAMISGANRFQAALKITMPLLRTAVISAAIMMVILSMRELTASLLLYTTDTRVLSIVIFEAYEQGMWSEVASISLIYTVLLLLLTFISRRWMKNQF